MDLYSALILLGGVAAVLLLLRWYEPRVLFYPHVPGRRIEQTPDSAGLPYREVKLLTEDGEHLHSWHVGAQGPRTILFCHGNAGNISHRIDKCRVLVDLGVDVFIFDYRGYGQSTGRPSEKGFYLDARAACEYLIGNLGVPAERTIIYGESLGTGVAVHLASERRVGGLILEAPYTSIPDVAQKMLWFLPVRYLVKNRFESLRKITKLGTPLLLLHSQDDEIFELRHAQRLFEAAMEPKRLVELRGPHDGAYSVSEREYRAAISQFLAEIEREG
jgi:hypothetical protein